MGATAADEEEEEEEEGERGPGRDRGAGGEGGAEATPLPTGETGDVEACSSGSGDGPLSPSTTTVGPSAGLVVAGLPRAGDCVPTLPPRLPWLPERRRARDMSRTTALALAAVPTSIVCVRILLWLWSSGKRAV